MSRIETIIQRSVQPIHHRFRSDNARQFISLLSTRQTGRLLDVGGGTGMNGEFITLYQGFDSVTVANLDPPHHDAGGPYNIRIVKADGRFLPFSDKSFDWIFSNAVIEHIGNREISDNSQPRSGGWHREGTSSRHQIFISYRASRFVATVPILSRASQTICPACFSRVHERGYAHRAADGKEITDLVSRSSGTTRQFCKCVYRLSRCITIQRPFLLLFHSLRIHKENIAYVSKLSCLSRAPGFYRAPSRKEG